MKSTRMNRVGRTGNRALFRRDESAPRAEIFITERGYPNPRQELKGGKKVR